MFYYALSLFLLTTVYVLVLILLRTGLRNLKAGTSRKQPNVSVIIAARNEEKNIHACLTAILAQSYPKQKLEIIVIDDRSEDRTAEIVKNFAASHTQIKLLQIQEPSLHLAPKKRAIDSGIRHATGEIIVTTDADCEPGAFWIIELMKYFEPDVGLVAGFNPYKNGHFKKPLCHQMLALDYFAMACVAAASAGFGYPISCSGGNLAYRKKVYLQLGGFKKISNWISGDDDFFLEQVREKTPWKIRYATNPQTFVPTVPPENLKDFVHQRIRYASKGSHYKLPVTLGLISVYLLNLLMTIGLIITLFNHKILPIWFAGFLGKTLAEFVLLKKGVKVFSLKFNLSTFFLTEVLHPIYIVLAGFLAQFKDFQWKGEEYSARFKNDKYESIEQTET